MLTSLFIGLIALLTIVSVVVVAYLLVALSILLKRGRVVRNLDMRQATNIVFKSGGEMRASGIIFGGNLLIGTLLTGIRMRPVKRQRHR